MWTEIFIGSQGYIAKANRSHCCMGLSRQSGRFPMHDVHRWISKQIFFLPFLLFFIYVCFPGPQAQRSIFFRETQYRFSRVGRIPKSLFSLSTMYQPMTHIREGNLYVEMCTRTKFLERRAYNFISKRSILVFNLRN
jgi:hypothetical protein